MNFKALSVCGLSLALFSCSSTDPEYEQYKKEKEAAAQSGGDPYSNIANPYGVPSGAPQGGEVGQYNANPSTPPFQPLPGVPPTQGNYPTIPNSNPPAYNNNAPATVTTHVVAKGDSLWGLSRKYGTSADAIRQANGLTSDLIQLGQTLQIPR